MKWNKGTYSTNGCRSVQAESMRVAAETFATRMARREFGRQGYARTCNLTSWSQDGSLGEYHAFIGYRTGQHETTGRDVQFTVLLGSEGAAQ